MKKLKKKWLSESDSQNVEYLLMLLESVSINHAELEQLKEKHKYTQSSKERVNKLFRDAFIKIRSEAKA